MSMRQRKILLLPLLFVLAAGIGVYFFVSQDAGPQTLPENTQQTADTPRPAAPAGEPTRRRPLPPVEPLPVEPVELPEVVATSFSVTLIGRVVNERGEPAAGVQLLVAATGLVEPRAPNPSEVPMHVDLGLRAVSNPQGEYQAVFELPHQSDAADLTVTTRSTRHMPGDPVHLRAVRAGETRRGVDHVVLEAGALVGYVRDQNGAPLESIAVVATRVDASAEPPQVRSGVPGRRFHSFLGSRPVVAQSDANGEYRFPLLRAGEWQIDTRVLHMQKLEGPGVVNVQSGMLNRASADIVLSAPTFLRLWVLDLAGNRPHERDVEALMLVFKLPTGDSVSVSIAADDDGLVELHSVPLEATSFSLYRHGELESGPYSIALVEGAVNEGPTIRISPYAGRIGTVPGEVRDEE